MQSSLAIMILILTSFGLQSCDKPSAEYHSELEDRPVPITTASVLYETLSSKHTAVGTLTAPKQIQIFNQETGRITRLPFYEGDRVQEGDELVVLNDELLRAEMTKSAANRRQAELDLLRMKKLFSRQAASEDEVARAHTALELAKAEENLQHLLLGRARIIAPFSGVISARLKEPGDVVPVNSHILTLIDPSQLSIELHVSELLLSDLDIDDYAQIHIDALEDGQFQGRISRIHPVIDPETRQGIIEVALNPVPKGARPGQLARVTFTIQETTGLTIPFASLHFDNKGSHVYRIDTQNTARRVSVLTGLQLGERIEILSGLQKDEQVVLSGLLNMTEGRKVRIVEAYPNG